MNSLAKSFSVYDLANVKLCSIPYITAINSILFPNVINVVSDICLNLTIRELSLNLKTD